MNDKKQVNLHHARGEDQANVLKKILQDGVCPFCREHLFKYHTRPILKESTWWMLTENFVPYDGARIHLLAICTKHVETITELPMEAHAELLSLFSDFVQEQSIKGGTIVYRFGDMDMTGSTVQHLHAQMIVGGSRKESPEKIRTKIGYKYISK